MSYLVAAHTPPEKQHQMEIYREHLTGNTDRSQGKSQVSILLAVLGSAATRDISSCAWL